VVAGCTLAVLLNSCSINPATGNRQFNLIGEGQEIALGREADPQIVAQFGLYPDEDTQRYVASLGQALAAKSERPGLPWTFRVLDDPLVNAFALPGGFIYVTRGIMTHLNSEAELVGVLGHEIGHVTARHGVNQMSKGMVAEIGLGVGAVLAPEAAQAYGGLAQVAAQLMFLKFGRDDERQSDALGVRYALETGYDPHSMVGVFETLGRVSEASGGGGMPGWASTHPSPENRSDLILAEIGGLGAVTEGLKVDHDGYLQSLDGMVFGDDPRQGYFEGEAFYHPQMAFQLRFPSGWSTQNTRQNVVAVSAAQDAIVQLSLAQASDVGSAASTFLRQAGVVPKGSFRPTLQGIDGRGERFSVQDASGQDAIVGLAVFAAHQGQVFQLLGYTKADRGAAYGGAISDSLDSFRSLRDRAKLDAQPFRVDVFRVARGDRFDRIPEIRASSLALEELALMNRLDPNSEVRSGTLLKTVRGSLPGR
jgi:predicted Zn-dependent protease